MPTWTEKLAVGHAAIDEQHRELFAQADQLMDAMHARRAMAEVEKLIDFLRDYCRAHFAMEEGIMAANLYPRAAGHVEQHREFQRRFKAIEDHLAARGATAAVVLEVKDLIRGWLVSHIGTIDQQLAEYLNGLPTRAAPKSSAGG